MWKKIWHSYTISEDTKGWIYFSLILRRLRKTPHPHIIHYFLQHSGASIFPFPPTKQKVYFLTHQGAKNMTKCGFSGTDSAKVSEVKVMVLESCCCSSSARLLLPTATRLEMNSTRYIIIYISISPGGKTGYTGVVPVAPSRWWCGVMTGPTNQPVAGPGYVCGGGQGDTQPRRLTCTGGCFPP